MTAFNLADIPSNINTLERLITWAGQAMQSCSNGLTVNVTANEAQQPYASVNLAVLANDVPHFLVSVYIPYDVADLNDPEEKTWMAAKDITTATPHINFLSN
jgi:hypothetical protein